VSTSGIADRARTFQEATHLAQKRHVLETLEATSWSVAETARQLDISRSHLYNLMASFGLQRQTL